MNTFCTASTIAIATYSLKYKDLNNGRRCALKRVIDEYWWVNVASAFAQGAEGV